MPSQHPHIVWIMADQLRWDALGYMGNPIVRTPSLDRLARSGVVFDNMHAQTPVCMTSRACQLTGRYLRNLNMANGCPVLDPWETTLPELLQRAGYRTGLFGKLHLTPQQYTMSDLKSDRPIHDAERFFPAMGWDDRPVPGAPEKQNYGFQNIVGFEDSLWGEYLPWLIEKAPEALKGLPVEAWRKGEISARQCLKANRKSEYPGSGMADVGVNPLPHEVHPSMFLGEQAAAFFRARHAEQPTFTHLSFVDPHHPFDPPADVAALYPKDDMPLPKHREATVEWPASLTKGAIDFSRVTDDHARAAIAYYYAMVDVIDRGVGKLVDAIEETGEMENTLFVFSTDHGEMLGDFGLFKKGSYHYDCMTKTPVFVSAPGRIEPGRRVKGVAQSIDLSPTLLSLAGLPSCEAMQGDDLSAPLLDGAPIGREWAYTEMHNGLWGPFVACWTVRTEGAKLNYYPNDRFGLLFDLEADPDEARDLWRAPEGRALRDEMTDLLLHCQGEQTDPLPRVMCQY